MNYQFYFNESRINDFIDFPRLIYAEDEIQTIGDDDVFHEIMDKDFKEFLTQSESYLKPFKKEIEFFYSRDFMDSYDFNFLITKTISFFGYVNEESYLNHLLTLTDEEIKQSMITTMLSNENKNVNISFLMDKALEISKDKKEIMALINDLPIDSGVKWNLFIILEDTKNYMRQYVELMFKILPIYLKLYSKIEATLTDTGNNFVDMLNQKGEAGLEEITFSMIDSELITEDTNKVLISYVSSFALKIDNTSTSPYIVWGLKMDKVFQAMKEKQENKLNERIQVFKNLGDKTRYEVLRLLASGESSTKNIAKALEVSSATISYHINALVTSHIVRYEKTNNRIGYLIDFKLIEEAYLGLKNDLNIEDNL